VSTASNRDVSFGFFWESLPTLFHIPLALSFQGPRPLRVSDTRESIQREFTPCVGGEGLLKLSLLHKNPKFFARFGRFKPVLAVVLLGLLVLAGMLASSPSLHTKLHSNGSADTHDCVICLFGQGLLATADASPFLIILALCFLGLLLPTPTRAMTIGDYRLSPSRAPPLGSSSNAVVG
jgi:hypothetical protein